MDVTMQLSIGYKKSLKSIRRIRRLVPNAPHPEALMRWASYHALGWISNNDPAKLGMLQADWHPWLWNMQVVFRRLKLSLVTRAMIRARMRAAVEAVVEFALTGNHTCEHRWADYLHEYGLRMERSNIQSIMSTRLRKTYISTTSSTSLLLKSRPRAEVGVSYIASRRCEYRGVILSGFSEIIVDIYGGVRFLLLTVFATV